MAALSAGQADAIVKRGRDILQDAADLTAGTDPNYIRDAVPDDLFEALPLAAARQGCRRYADKGGNYPERRAARAERACRPYLDSLPYGEGPKAVKPFEGGQCPVAYGVTYNSRNRTSASTNCAAYGATTVRTNLIPSSPAPIGPITSARQVLASDPSGLPLRDSSEQWQVQAANGLYFLSLGGASGRQYWAACGPSYDITNIVFTPLSGTAVCGPVPPDYVPPVPPIGGPGPVQEPFVISPNVNIDIEVVVNPDGTIDIDIGTGPINIDPFDEPADPGAGGEPGAGDQTDPGSPGAGGGTGAGGDADGMAPDGQELVGLLVTVTDAPGDANRFDNNSKQPFRGIGYVRMGYPGRLGLDISGGTVISPQFFHAPQRGLTNWSVAANIGFNLTIVPYYRPIEP